MLAQLSSSMRLPVLQVTHREWLAGKSTDIHIQTAGATSPKPVVVKKAAVLHAGDAATG
jgi:hypothetical protein